MVRGKHYSHMTHFRNSIVAEESISKTDGHAAGRLENDTPWAISSNSNGHAWPPLLPFGLWRTFSPDT